MIYFSNKRALYFGDKYLKKGVIAEVYDIFKFQAKTGITNERTLIYKLVYFFQNHP